MDALELAMHTLKVIQGEVPPHDIKKAQPVGPAEDSTTFLTMLASVSFCLFVATYIIEAVGHALGKSLGLRRGKVTRFTASFLEFVYYSVSIALGACVFSNCKWFWPTGWDEIMHDGRVQKIPGLPAYHISGEWVAVCVNA
jgi:hypothetical protein